MDSSSIRLVSASRISFVMLGSGGCRTRQRDQSYCGFTLCQRSVRTASPLPTTTRCTRWFQVGDYAKGQLVRPKDVVDPAKQDGVVYRIPCECGKVYIGETGRPIQDRIKEHD